ncbi:MAG: hypothetical protein AB4038_18910, partial [Prochloraceae cyanobacterium]
MFAVQRKHFEKLVPWDARERKLPAESVLSGMWDTCIVHLGKCYAGMPDREVRKPKLYRLRSVWENVTFGCVVNALN